MVSELVRPQEAHPLINPPGINSESRGKENIAKVLGSIAERTIVKATDYASEASKANLLETHSMLQDVEAQSKIEIARSPGHADIIAKNANTTIEQIKTNAKLNHGDRLNLDNLSKNTVRNLNLTAAQKSIDLTRETAKYSALSSFGNTLQSIRQSIIENPEVAEQLIEAQYEAIKGQVESGIITAVEAANLHKQFMKEIGLSQEILQGVKDGTLDASDMSTYHATDTAQVPLSNAHLPMAHDTALNADHHYGNLTLHDVQSKMANGESVTPRDLLAIKSSADLDKVLNYGAGAARATGDINSGKSFVELTHKLDSLKKKEKLSAREEGYKNRLNNFVNGIQEPGAYQNFVMGTPEGARIYQDFTQTQTAIEQDVPFGTDEQVSVTKHMRSVDNLNNLISKSDSLGIGMHLPDYIRQPIPIQYLTPIVSAFNKGGDIQSAINNIQMLTPKNRAYVMNAFPKDYRKQLTVYEIGNLASGADQSFLTNLMRSQQVDALGETTRKQNKQEAFLQLDTSKENSDKKLLARINPNIASISTYLRYQPNGSALNSAKSDQALRYIKLMAADHGDTKIEHFDDYMKSYTDNMQKAYGTVTGYNFVMDTNNVPLEENQMQVLASHATNDVRNKLLEYRSKKDVDNLFSDSPPILVSSPGGRLSVVDSAGNAIPDKYGHPAYSELFTESTWQAAEHDASANTGYKPVVENALGYLRIKANTIRPAVEGNIDLEERPKVYDEKGRAQFLKAIPYQEGEHTVLIPRVINEQILSPKAAIQYYQNNGEHLGVFKDKKEAEDYYKLLLKRHRWEE